MTPEDQRQRINCEKGERTHRKKYNLCCCTVRLAWRRLFCM